MKDDKSEQEFLDQVKQRLDDTTDQIDELTLARLGAARRRAVEAGSHQHSILSMGDILTAVRGRRFAWLAGGLFLLLLLATLRLQTPVPSTQPLLLDDMELLSAAEELEFYRELDFFIWVADEQDEG